ncbi:ubiquinone biosynthesis O-methyltransferase, mitochondrial-like [Gigantopelta aegis]|uniref:ubiquinone biosynthesis O-methyltransferase, mitochondrial-like n=1 Tax=Gigantopelta aegis TaxID=1735272 RepID=UPI001B88A9F1|nr:ubiquinone biosynthesis O-methyltransferase, mitochondrial-like [Gigantopelta aegis]
MCEKMQPRSMVRRYLLVLPVLRSQVHCIHNEFKQRSKKLVCDEKKLTRTTEISKQKLLTPRVPGISLDGRPYSKSTIDEEEIRRFSALADLWWDESGEFEALHTMNELRIPLIRDGLTQQKFSRGDQVDDDRYLLEGFRILDVGCGGGILSEPLARLGAEVTGLEACEETIKIAQNHLLQNSDLASKVTYVKSTVEEMAEQGEGHFDSVVASEVVEHVADVSTFIHACSKLIKPGGSMFLTTLNKTYLSYALGIVFAERILNLVPAGTHDWNKFLQPQDLQYILNKNGFSTRLLHGMCYNFLTKRWSWTKDTSINYSLHAVYSPDS